MTTKPGWCDWWTDDQWRMFLRLLKAVDRDDRYPASSGDRDLRILAAAVRDADSGRWSVTIKEHVERYQQAPPDGEPHQEPPLDRERFTEQVLAGLRQAGVHNVRVDRENFALHTIEPDGEPGGVLNLGPTFAECQQAPAETPARIAKLIAIVTSASESFDTWASARERLRPVLRAATYGLDPDMEFEQLSRPALPFLQERVVIDLPTSMQYVTPSRLADWGVSADEVFAAARANLAATAPWDFPPGDDGPVILNFVDEDGDLYLSSLPLLDGWLAATAPAVGGRPVAFMAEHSSLLVVSDGDQLAHVLELIEKDYREAPRSLSPMAYTVDDSGAVVPYPVLAGHPAQAAVRRAATMLAATEYNSQKDWLDERHEAEMVDIFTASLMVNEAHETVAVWGQDVDTLLPRADRVAFVGDTQEPILVPWETVTQLVPLSPEPEFDPPRYRVRSWPSADVMQQLLARAE